MNDYTIIVTVKVSDAQRKAFDLVENALSDWLERHEDITPDSVHVSTPDGTRSTAL